MVLAPPSVAWRCAARAAAASSRKLTTIPRPSPASHQFLMASRPLSSATSTPSPTIGTRPIGGAALPPASSAASSLASGMFQLSLRDDRRTTQPQRPLSTRADPLGEPVAYLTLSNLSDNPGAVKKARRVGRGIGSSKGKTCGRGHKGQKARAGRGVHPTFEGGQTKFYKRLPKIGKMKNHKFKLELIPVNVGMVQNYVTMGRLKAERSDGVITMRDMVRAGMFPASSIKSGVKLLGDGADNVTDKLHIEVPWASTTAIEAIEGKGGFVTTVHYNRLALRALLKPEKFPPKPEAMLERESGEGEAVDVGDNYLLPKRARPPPKYMPYYTDYAKRGYLNPKVQMERMKRGMKDIL